MFDARRGERRRESSMKSELHVIVSIIVRSARAGDGGGRGSGGRDSVDAETNISITLVCFQIFICTVGQHDCVGV